MDEETKYLDRITHGPDQEAQPPAPGTTRDRRPVEERLADQFPDKYGLDAKILTDVNKELVTAVLCGLTALLGEQTFEQTVEYLGKRIWVYTTVHGDGPALEIKPIPYPET